MSHLLDFPPSQLPRDINAPPYVVFGRNGIAITGLPREIPLRVVLHYVPKTVAWVLPPPLTSSLPAVDARFSLRKPHVGINITDHELDIVGLALILVRIMQLSGADVSRDFFVAQRTLLACVSIHKAWTALDLPPEGLDNLHLYMCTHMHCGAAVTLPEIDAIWKTFGPNSEITRAMGLNYMQRHIEGEYSDNGFERIFDWYKHHPERSAFFRALHSTLPKIDVPEEEKLDDTARRTVARHERSSSSGTMRSTDTLVFSERPQGSEKQAGAPKERAVKKEWSQEEDQRGTVARGRSFNASVQSFETAVCIPTGSEDNEETIVLDKASGKKPIKDAQDSKPTHKPSIFTQMSQSLTMTPLSSKNKEDKSPPESQSGRPPTRYTSMCRNSGREGLPLARPLTRPKYTVRLPTGALQQRSEESSGNSLQLPPSIREPER